MAADELEREILEFLAGHNVIHLATSGQDGVHCASLFYVNDGFSLHWVSDPASRHSRELLADGHIAATVAPEYDAYTEIRGLQIAGVARRASGLVETTYGLGLLAKKFSFFKDFMDGPRALVERLGKAVVYRLDARQITLIDNTKGFGHKETFVVPQ